MATNFTKPGQLLPVTSTIIKTISIMRISLGAACVVAPQTTCGLFNYSVPLSFSILTRLFGIRDLALGVLLQTAEDKKAPSGGRRELRRSLWANIASDGVDAVSVAFSLAQGNLEMLPAMSLGLGAVTFLIMEGIAICYDSVFALWEDHTQPTYPRQS